MAQWQSTGGLSQRCPGFDSWELPNNWSQPVATYILSHLACVLMRISYSELIKLWRHILCASIPCTGMYNVKLWRYSMPTFQCMWRIVGLVVVWILHITHSLISRPYPAFCRLQYRKAPFFSIFHLRAGGAWEWGYTTQQHSTGWLKPGVLNSSISNIQNYRTAL